MIYSKQFKLSKKVWIETDFKDGESANFSDAYLKNTLF